MTIDITGGLGEAEAGGPVINVVPKTGGNTFSGSGFAGGANGSLQGSNFDDALVAAGLREPGKLKKLWETNGAHRRADQEGQALVLPDRPLSGDRALRGGHVLQQERRQPELLDLRS